MIPVRAGPAQLPGPGAQPGGMLEPSAGLPGAAPASGQTDPLGTVGLALLAYGLVQLLARVVDRIPLGKTGGGESAGDGFTPEDRKRLERLLEIAVADHARMERMQEELREVYDYARWAAEQRRSPSPRRGETLWRQRGQAILDQLATNQRLIGQALDELRETQKKLDNVLRKLRALWARLGRRRGEGE